MGKGHTRLRRGKIYNGSCGKKRPRRARNPSAPAQRPTTAQ